MFNVVMMMALMSLKDCTVPELKELCKKYNESVTGKKLKLIGSLIKHVCSRGGKCAIHR